MQIPNLKLLMIGTILTLVFSAHLIVNIGYDFSPIFFTAILGLPVAFLYLMFTNPTEKKPGDWGIVLVLPFCAIMWPIVLAALLVGKPWKDETWSSRPSHRIEEQENS